MVQVPHAGIGVEATAELNVVDYVSDLFDGEGVVSSLFKNSSAFTVKGETRSYFNKIAIDSNDKTSHKIGEDVGQNVGYGFSWKVSAFATQGTWDVFDKFVRRKIAESLNFKF